MSTNQDPGKAPEISPADELGVVPPEVLESLPEGILALGPTGEIVAFNRKLSALWAIPGPILASLDFASILGEIRPQLMVPQTLQAEIDRVINEPGIITDATVELKDGRMIECHSEPLMASRNALGRVWTFRDVTIQAKVVAALREQLRLSDLVMDSLPEHIYFKDRESRFTKVNKSMARLFGFDDPQELVGKSDFDFFSDEHARQAYADERQLIEEQVPVLSMEEKETWPDGHETWVLTTKLPLRNRAGRLVGTFGISRDITARKNAERVLQESVSLLNATLEATGDGILVIDRERHVVNRNQSFLDMWHLPPSLHSATQDSMLVDFVESQLSDPNGFREGINRVYAEPTQETTCVLRFNDGRIFERSSRPQRMGQDIVGTVWTFRDITERESTAAALRRQTAELARSNAELEQFAYVASHDLQEPLRMVASYTQLLARRYKDRLDADADEFIYFAVDGATRMQRLINDLLSYSRVTTKGREFKPVDTQAVLRQALTNLKGAADESAATVTCDPLPLVKADERQLEQLFQNLIGNAIKFHGPQSPHVHVSAERDTAQWVFSVKDNGIGIENRYLDRIFVVFQRLHSSSEFPGTGIGLAICKKIVERHGGRIWVVSEPGKGSTFYFTIPDNKP